jgi:biopolymer transport protein ExbD
MGWNLKGSNGWGGGGGRGGSGGGGSIMAEINITPLTDVMLVLLVIFMVTTPLIMVESFKLKLPKAVTSTAETGKGVTVSISAAGVININGRPVTKDRFAAELKKEFSERGDRTVVLRADADTRHRLVVEVLDTARLAGAERLSIATLPGRTGPAR